MKTFFFGAGSSFGTLEYFDACPPLAKDFSTCLCKRPDFKSRYPNLVRAAEHLGKDLEQIGLEELWTCLDYYAKLSGDPGALGPNPPWLWPAVEELKKDALLWLYGQRCDQAAESLPDSDSYTLGDVFKNQIQNGDVVVSFNYDTIVERLARRMKVRLQHCSGPPRDFVKFVKPHGSSSWDLQQLPPNLIDGEPLLDSLKETEHKDPLLLGAVPIKSELLREIQDACRAPDVFKMTMHQWQGVVEAVRDADVLVVVGYSFPKEDQYGRFLFQEGMRIRGKPLKKIEYYNLSVESGFPLLEVFGSKNIELVWRGRVTPAPV